MIDEPDPIFLVIKTTFWGSRVVSACVSRQTAMLYAEHLNRRGRKKHAYVARVYREDKTTAGGDNLHPEWL